MPLCLAIMVSGCASAQAGGSSNEGGLTAIYSPPVRLGGQGAVVYLPTPSKSPAPAKQSSPPTAEHKSSGGETPPPDMFHCYGYAGWIVFFHKESTAVSAEQQDVLRDLLTLSRGRCGGFDIVVRGHSHHLERPGIALQRAKIVRSYLLEHGFKSKISIEDVGSREPRVPIDDKLADMHNPRVEIRER